MSLLTSYFTSLKFSFIISKNENHNCLAKLLLSIGTNKVKHVIVAFYKQEWWWWWCPRSHPRGPHCPGTAVFPHLCCCFSQPIRTCFQNKLLCLYMGKCNIEIQAFLCLRQLSCTASYFHLHLVLLFKHYPDPNSL